MIDKKEKPLVYCEETSGLKKGETIGQYLQRLERAKEEALKRGSN